MEILLFVFFVVFLVALAYFRSQIGDLRADLAESQAKLDASHRALANRLWQLERASAEKRIEPDQPASPVETPLKVAVEATAPPPRPTVGAQPMWEPRIIQQPQPPPPQSGTTPQASPVSRPHLAQAPPFAATDASRAETPSQNPIPDQIVPEPIQSLSLEERLGANWLPKLGISILVIGVAFFLAPRLVNMGPRGKALTGLTVSLILLLGGLCLERKPTYRIFARAGIGGGWALLFFTTFAMHHLDATRVIASLVTDLLLMLLVATGMVLHSLRYRSQSVTGLAFLLGFATLATSDLEASHGSVVFSLIASAVLALGLVVVTTLRHWAWLELAGLAAVVANHFLWLAIVIPGSGGVVHFPLFWQSTALILFYWAIFRAAYLLRLPLNVEEDRISSLSAVVLAGGVLGLLKFQSAHPEWAFRALLAMGTVEMLLGIWSRSRRRSAFLVLTTVGSVLLVTSVPFQFHGVSWPILWLVEAHALALCGLRLDEPVFRRLGLLTGFAASLVLAVRDLLPLVEFRLSYPDPSHHPSLAIGLALAAALFWLHGEVYPRRWPHLSTGWGEFELVALVVTSWLGVAAAAATLWVVLPSAWIAVGWLALALLLGLASDWKSIVSLALQADALGIAAILALFVWSFSNDLQPIQKLPTAIAIALYYAGMRRRTQPVDLVSYVSTGYSWVAFLLLCVWTYQAIDDKWIILAWVMAGVVLFELGSLFHKSALRWQSFVTSALAFFWLQGRWFDEAFLFRQRSRWFPIEWHTLLAILTAAAAAYLLQERTRAQPEPPADGAHTASPSGRSERWVGLLAGLAGTWIVASWLPVLVPTWGRAESATIVWAILASGLLTVALLTQRASFEIHALLVALWTGLCGMWLAVNPTITESNLFWWQGSSFRFGLASAILLCGLPAAFRLRRLWTADGKWSILPEPTATAVGRPEQWFFFIPFGWMIVTLAAKLSEGNITLGWSLLGLGAFIFALLVGQRSFRLGGLALLLLSVVKILLMDVWTLAPTDRYITLIVMGCALLVVSFLYTRFRDVFRKYL